MKDRIVEERVLLGRDVTPHPENWKRHPELQREALDAVLERVGKVGKLKVYDSPTLGDNVCLDGHMRIERYPDEEWKADVLDVDDEEALEVLSTFDALPELAAVDEERLELLHASADLDDDRLAAIRGDGAGIRLPRPETVRLSSLTPHPRNYNEHPDDQLGHLVESIKSSGVYNLIVVAEDSTILAGHGVAEAAGLAGLEFVKVRRLRLDPDSPQALKVLAGDNEVAHLGVADDRALSEMLKEVLDAGDDEGALLGTGYDRPMLANLAMVTRSADEIEDFDAAALWAGMPEYTQMPSGTGLKVVVNFRNREDRRAFAEKLGVEFTEKTRSMWWPEREREDLLSVRFVADKEGEDGAGDEAA